MAALVKIAFVSREKSTADPEKQRQTEEQSHNNTNTKMPNSDQHRRIKNVCTMIVSQIVLCAVDDSSQGLSGKIL